MTRARRPGDDFEQDADILRLEAQVVMDEDGGADWAAFYSRIANSERPFCASSRNLRRPAASQNKR